MSARYRLTSTHFKFGLVGILNTATDFGIYSLLLVIGWVPLAANTVSTSCGMVLSFFLNRHFTFNAQQANRRRQAGLFLLFTVAGLWILQPAVIYLVRFFAHHVLGTSQGSLPLNLFAKLCSIGVSLCWNYYWYKNHVFKKVADGHES